MLAVVKSGSGFDGVNLENIELNEIDNHSVKIDVKAVGICGTDLSIIKDQYPHSLPVILGHEFSGVVSEVGSSVSKFKAGDRVVSLTATNTCGFCSYCRQGLIMLCSKRKSIGSGVNGAMAQKIIVPEENVLLMPDNVSYEEASLTEPLACVVRGLMERTHIRAEDKVFISGCGTIGLLALQVALANGATVIVSGTSDDLFRLETALALGAISTVNVDEEQFSEIIPKNNHELFDVVIECAGVKASLDLCLSLVKKQGRFIQLGLYGEDVAVDFDQFLMKEINYTSSFATTANSWFMSLELMRTKKVDLKPLITDIYPLEQWQKAFKSVFNRRGIKTLIRP